MKTVLGQEVKGWEDFPDNQLLRCPKQKQYEAELLLTIPKGSSFIDIGAHYGDTVITMALFAQANLRADIRFFAFEPNIAKCEHMRRICQLNQLSVNVLQTAVGDAHRRVSRSSQYAAESGQSTYVADAAGTVDMAPLDDFAAVLQPVGYLHIDAEGWDAHCLLGARRILHRDAPYVIAELWSSATALRNGFSGQMEADIAAAMRPHTKLVRQKNVVDQETNMVFYPAGQVAKLRALRQLITSLQ